MSIPNSPTIRSPCPSPWPPEVGSLSLWVCFCFVNKFICITSFYNGMPLSCQKEWNHAICSITDGPTGCHTELSKSPIHFSTLSPKLWESGLRLLSAAAQDPEPRASSVQHPVDSTVSGSPLPLSCLQAVGAVGGALPWVGKWFPSTLRWLAGLSGSVLSEGLFTNICTWLPRAQRWGGGGRSLSWGEAWAGRGFQEPLKHARQCSRLRAGPLFLGSHRGGVRLPAPPGRSSGFQRGSPHGSEERAGGSTQRRICPGRDSLPTSGCAAEVSSPSGSWALPPPPCPRTGWFYFLKTALPRKLFFPLYWSKTIFFFQETGGHRLLWFHMVCARTQWGLINTSSAPERPDTKGY